MLYKWCNIIIWKYFFWWEKGLHRRFVYSTGSVDVSITNGSRYEPAVMGAHHQRLAHASLPVYEPAVMNPAITAGSGPAITIDLNPTVPKTVGDAVGTL